MRRYTSTLRAQTCTYTSSCFYHWVWRLIRFLYKLLMMHSYPTSFAPSRPHTCTAAHIRDAGMVMASPSSNSTMHLATRGLLYEHYASIFLDLCLPTGHIASLSCSPLQRVVPGKSQYLWSASRKQSRVIWGLLLHCHAVILFHFSFSIWKCFI